MNGHPQDALPPGRPSLVLSWPYKKEQKAYFCSDASSLTRDILSLALRAACSRPNQKTIREQAKKKEINAVSTTLGNSDC